MLCELHQECEYGWKSREVDRENAGQVVCPITFQQLVVLLHFIVLAVVLQGAEVC